MILSRVLCTVIGISFNCQQTFLETSPILLFVTAVVSFVHLLFDILAFKNGAVWLIFFCAYFDIVFFLLLSFFFHFLIAADISFWRNRKSMKGISFRYCPPSIALVFSLRLAAPSS
jgi:hypothetical protein